MSEYCSKCGVKFIGGVCPSCYGTQEEQNREEEHNRFENSGYTAPPAKPASAADPGRIAIIAILSVIALSLIALVFLVARGSGRNSYVSQYDSEPGTGSAYSYEETNSYDDSLAEDTAEEQQKQPALSVGDIITLGSYEQDNDTSDGTEPIEWRVLDVDGSRALVITEKCIDVVQYNNGYEVKTWENSHIRRWLNNSFYSAAFLPEEKSRILETLISNPDNPEHGTDCGSDTYDRIFCLSIQEAERYFSDSTRKAAPTVRVSKMKAVVSKNDNIQVKNGFCWWNLRSQGKHRKSAACVSPEGEIYYSGRSIDCDVIPVRPAMYISLDG